MEFEKDSYQGMALGRAAHAGKNCDRAVTAQRMKSRLSVWQLRPLGAPVEIPAETARLEADAMIRTSFSNCTTTEIRIPCE